MADISWNEKTLRELAKFAHRTTKSILKKDRELCSPMVLLYGRHPEKLKPMCAIVPLLFLDRNGDKHAAAARLRLIAAAMDADAYCITADAWMVDLHGEDAEHPERLKVRPSQHPDRVEVIYTLAEAVGTSVQAAILEQYSRDAQGQPHNFRAYGKGYESGGVKNMLLDGILDHEDLSPEEKEVGRALFLFCAQETATPKLDA